MLEPKFEDAKPAFRVEVIQTYDGFVLQKEGTALRYGYDGSVYYGGSDWLNHKKLSQFQEISIWNDKLKAICRAEQLERDSQRAVFNAQRAAYDEKQRRSFVERRVWR